MNTVTAGNSSPIPTLSFSELFDDSSVRCHSLNFLIFFEADMYSEIFFFYLLNFICIFSSFRENCTTWCTRIFSYYSALPFLIIVQFYQCFNQNMNGRLENGNSIFLSVFFFALPCPFRTWAMIALYSILCCSQQCLTLYPLSALHVLLWQ